MTAYKDEKRGTWFANFRYKDWRGVPQGKSKRGFRTRREVTYNLLRTLTAAQSRYQKTWRLPLV